MPKEDTLVIHEIYASIQGESTFAGLPCTFVRTTGCNLRCVWCDTPQAFYGGTRMSRDHVRREALGTGTGLIVRHFSMRLAVSPSDARLQTKTSPY